MVSIFDHHTVSPATVGFGWKEGKDSAPTPPARAVTIQNPYYLYGSDGPRICVTREMWGRVLDDEKFSSMSTKSLSSRGK